MPIQTLYPVTFGKKYLKLFLSDRFTDGTGAPLPSDRPAQPGPGSLVKSTDTGNNAYVSNCQLKVCSVVGDLDPSYYWTKAGGTGFTRKSGLALIFYATGTPWFGWSNTETLSNSNLLYGVKERSAFESGFENVQALPVGDPAHIIVLRDTGALHICRIGTSTTAALKWGNELNGNGNERLWRALGAVAAKRTKPERPQLSGQPATTSDTTAAALPRSSGVTGQHA